MPSLQKLDRRTKVRQDQDDVIHINVTTNQDNSNGSWSRKIILIKPCHEWKMKNDETSIVQTTQSGKETPR